MSSISFTQPTIDAAPTSSAGSGPDLPPLADLTWRVAVLKPQVQSRATAVRALQARGFVPFLPMCRELVFRDDGRSRVVDRPMFYRYVFVGCPAGADPWAIRWVPGVQHLTLDARRAPVMLAAPVVAAIADRLREAGGVLDLRPRPAPEGGSGFVEGQPVRITCGAFAGMEGLFSADEGERCRVLVSLFGRDVLARVSMADVVAVAPSGTTRQPARTPPRKRG